MDTSTLASCFKALSEPVRLRILSLLLTKGEICVCDLVDALQLSQSVVSRHLAYLRNSGMVSARRQGVWMHYRVTRDLDPALAPLLRYIRKLGDESEDLQADLTQLERATGC